MNTTSRVILHITAWSMLIFLPVFLLESFARISHYVPVHYYSSCLLLVPVYYLSNQFIKLQKGLRYLMVIAALFAVYFYLPVLICRLLPSNNLTTDIYSVPVDRMVKIRMGTTLLFLIVIAASIVNHVYTLKESERKLREENTKAELSLLKSQINPHFFFNALNTIYYLAMQKSNRAPKAIITLSDMMRYMLTEAEVEYSTMAREKEYLDKYIELQKLRLPEKTKLDYRVDITDNEVRIAPLLFIPFIENAFKYGISANTETVITIKIDVVGNRARLFVRNNIFLNEEAEESTENGLKNVKKRLELMYPGRYDLSVDRSGQTFTVKLSIMLE